jgi:hypothetical protein
MSENARGARFRGHRIAKIQENAGMITLRKDNARRAANFNSIRCNHPLAVVVDPTDQQVQQLEAMLSNCPNCSQWTPGDGPIMAVISSSPTELSKSADERV